MSKTTKTDETEVVAAQAAKKSGIFVVEGKSITTGAGIKTGGDEVTKDLFPEGDKTVADLVEKGYLEKI